MEAWKGQDLDAANVTTWLRLMNASTANLGLQFFNSNVVASPFNNASLNGSAPYGNDTLIIWSTGDLPSPAAIVGIATTFALLFTAFLVFLNWKYMFSPATYSATRTPEGGVGRTRPQQNRFIPRENTNTVYTTTGISISPIEMEERQHRDFADMGMHGVSAEKFVDLMRIHYGEQAMTERQIRETRANGAIIDDVQTEDLEEIMELARRVLRFDTELWSHRNTVGFTQSNKMAIQDKCDALELEMIALVKRLSTYDGWKPQELQELQEIMAMLDISPSNETTPEVRRIPIAGGQYDATTKSLSIPTSSDWASSSRSRR